jgi:CHAT domain-containing protein
VVEYFLGDGAAYVFTIAHTSVDIRTLHATANICALAQSLARTIRSVDRQTFISASEQLYASIIGPIAGAVESHDRLVFVPDRELARIPFEVLVPQAPAVRPGETSAYADLPYLLKSHEIVVAPSARIYCETAERASDERPQQMSFAGFAPVFRESTATGMILASNQFARDLDTTELRSFSVEGKRFRELAYSDAEVEGIAGEFTQKGFPARVLLNGMATEENFKRYAPFASFLHVATHGVVNERDPRRSALVFVQPSDTTKGDDGVLYAAETYNLELNADLVVLSCCESGIGPFVNGEGVYAMMRGFLYSGAHNIMYSLWQVMDHHTSELMQSFYEGVLKGWRFGRALRMAKLQMISRERTAFPFCWAGFVLVGQ